MAAVAQQLRREEVDGTAASSLELANCQRVRRINLPLLRRITVAALGELPGVNRWELMFYLVGARKMATVNQTHLGHSGPTDVITFDYGEGEARAKNHALHGEIFICIDVAVEQAREFRTTWQAEVVRYIVHGLLHLCGHDDLAPEPRRAMKRVENRLVRKLSARFTFAALGRQGM